MSDRLASRRSEWMLSFPALPLPDGGRLIRHRSHETFPDFGATRRTASQGSVELQFLNSKCIILHLTAWLHEAVKLHRNRLNSLQQTPFSRRATSLRAWFPGGWFVGLPSSPPSRTRQMPFAVDNFPGTRRIIATLSGLPQLALGSAGQT